MSNRNPRVLIVDDLEENRLALQALLKDEPIEIFLAASGPEALELFLQQDFALALIDVQMPDMNGFELAELVRGTERTRSVPIIFVTAGDRDRTRVFQGYDAGAVDFLYKPLDPHVVRSKVRVFSELFHQKELLSNTVTELRSTLQQLEEEHELREKLVSMVSHDVRTPLTAAKLSADLLTRGIKDPVGVERLAHRIRDAMDRADRMIRDLLDVNRLRGGKQIPIQVGACNLSDLVRSTMDELTQIHGNRFRLHGIDHPVEGYWDCEGMRRILENLCGNAVKYGEDQTPIDVALTERGNSRVELSVHNFGPAIPRELQATLFQPFERSQSAQRSGQRGWGIGLTLVKGIADAHDAAIDVKSSEPEGTTFSVILPRDCRPRESSPEQSSRENRTAS